MRLGLIIGDWVCWSTDQRNSDVMVMHHVVSARRCASHHVLELVICNHVVSARRCASYLGVCSISRARLVLSVLALL